MRPEFIEEILRLPQFKGQQIYRLTNLYEETIRRNVSVGAREEYIRSAIAPTATVRSPQPTPQPTPQPAPQQAPAQIDIDIDSVLQLPRWLQKELIQSYKRTGCSSKQLAALQQRMDELSAEPAGEPTSAPTNESASEPTSEPASVPEEKPDVSLNTVPDDLPF
jgi:hypothetical protein